MTTIKRPEKCPYCDGITADKLRCVGITLAPPHGRKYYECLFARNVFDAAVAPERARLPAAAHVLCKDGSSWRSVRADFIDLQESPAGFGDSPEEAMVDLLRAEMDLIAARESA